MAIKRFKHWRKHCDVSSIFSKDFRKNSRANTENGGLLAKQICKIREYFFLLGRVFEKMWISKVRGENINLSKYLDEFCIVEPKLNLKQTQVTTQVNSEWLVRYTMGSLHML